MATVCESNKIDSNITGLRIAEEICLKQLPSTANGDPADPLWIPYEPDKYSDFGATVSTTARNPINPSRQRKKGVVTDLDAKGGFTTDLTQTNLTRLMQGFMYADIREKATTAPMNGLSTAVTDVDSGTKAFDTTKTGFKVGDILLASGFSSVANNGLKTIASVVSGTSITVNETLADESPAASASLKVVGFEFPAADVSISMNGNLPRLVSATITMTTLGLVPGEWVYLGGDISANTFATNKGWARVGAVAATYVEFDKVSWAAPAIEAGTGKSVRLYMGSVIKNESDPALIKRRSYQLERTLGEDADGVQSQYVTGAVASEFTLNVKQADKVTMDLAFIACDAEARTGVDGLKSGSRPGLVESDAFNSSSDMKRIALSLGDPTTARPTALVAFVTDASLTIKNNVSGSKAVGVLGNFDVNTGTFDVGGSLTAYFQDVRAINAVRNNEDISLDMLLAKNNAGLALDVPLLSLGNGVPNVEQDQAITIPLDNTAAESAFGHTLLMVDFSYLPNIACA